jgi:hypothetical protein
MYKHLSIYGLKMFDDIAVKAPTVGIQADN